MNVEEIIKTNNEIPLIKRTIIHMSLVNNKINEAITCVLRPFDLSVQQFNVLRILRGQQGQPANLSTINERMVTKMSNTTRLVDKLILKDFVSRKVCPDNRRKVEITITENGLALLGKLDCTFIESEKHILKNFSETDLKNLNRLLDKF
jgi:DNA-binding MarR family transcriptional regulator